MKILLSLVHCFSFSITYAQQVRLIAKRTLHFQLIDPSDSIDFIVADTVLTEKKPVFLFCQGSLPVPLFIELKEHGLFMFGGGISNFDLDEIRKQYHLLVISMPKTPLLTSQDQVDGNYAYVPNPEKPRQYAQAYVAADYLENNECFRELDLEGPIEVLLLSHHAF